MNRPLGSFTVSLLVAALGSPAAAQTQSAEPRPAPVVIVPGGLRASVLATHLSAGNQEFDFTVAGLRAYLDSTKSSDPHLYAQLAPDLEHLESRTTAARVALLAGLGLGVASTIYAFGGRKDCVAPPVTDPAFAEHAAAWGACNDDNMRTTVTFTLIGLGSVIAGGAAWLAITPSRSDLFDLVNKHNRVSHTPLQYRIGYDPTRALAYGTATLIF
jgi:hypothetical protein